MGSEDCLLLNVYTPAKLFSNTSKVPILFLIHGGGFIRGCGMDPKYSPAKLLDRDVVLVTINYRLGVLGYLSSETEDIPPNVGMFDQIQALKWVQENIVSFGGDPKRVTIFGQTSGAVAVSLHLVSPQSKNLFHGAIIQSGTYFGFRSINEKPRKWTKRLAMKLKCPSVTMQQLVKCLMDKSPEELTTAIIKFQLVTILPKVFSPVVENRPNGFLPFDPQKELSKIKIDVPVIIGIVSEEGQYFYDTFEPFYAQNSQQFLDNDIPDILEGFHIEGNVKKYSNTLTNYYFKNISTTDTEAFKKSINKLYADLYNDVGTEKFIQLLGKQKNKYYTYKFSYRGSVCSFEYNCTNPGNRGPAHNEDLAFLFPVQNLTKTDSMVSDILMDLWTNFTTYSDPTPNKKSSFTWLPNSLDKPNYLEINLHSKMVNGHITDNTPVWDEANKALTDCA